MTKTEGTFVSFIQEIAMKPFDDISYKPMHRAWLILKKHHEIGVLTHDTLYLFVDKVKRDYYTHAKSTQYSFIKKSGKITTLDYWSVPADILARPRDLGQWVNDAFLASMRKYKKLNKKNS